MAVFTKPRQEPSFADMRRLADAEGVPPLRHSDYAQPEVRQAVAAVNDVEDEISRLVAQEPMRQSQPDIGNSADMQRVKQIVENAVTAAHRDTCKALDKVVAEIQKMADRAKKDVEEYKKGLESGGQDIAVLLEATMQTCKRTVEWIETVTPDLRNPTLTQPPEKPVYKKPTIKEKNGTAEELRIAEEARQAKMQTD